MAALERRNYGMVPAGESSIENMLKERKSRSLKSEMRHMFGGLYETSMPCNHHSFLGLFRARKRNLGHKAFGSEHRRNFGRYEQKMMVEGGVWPY
ncbi:hypothetical protein WN944_020482 [Citrus x changshan-huyou]|uniref:Uncharacterized protein n=1 Tax=Citrus x changshan-huyou TaxID=2935761 RepID=A0AAP0QEX2_9ROSI